MWRCRPYPVQAAGPGVAQGLRRGRALRKCGAWIITPRIFRDSRVPRGLRWRGDRAVGPSAPASCACPPVGSSAVAVWKGQLPAGSTPDVRPLPPRPAPSAVAGAEPLATLARLPAAAAIRRTPREVLYEAWQAPTTERVEVACDGGRGRTGTALACLAVIDGVPPEQAVAFVRQHYHRRPWRRPGSDATSPASADRGWATPTGPSRPDRAEPGSTARPRHHTPYAAQRPR